LNFTEHQKSIISFVEIYSLPKNHRLHNAEEFTAVIRYKCQASGDLIQMYAKPNNLGYSRLGLIVAKKVERRAVKRNRAKRILREIFRMNQRDEKTIKLDLVIRLRRPVAKNNSLHLSTEAKLLMLKLQQCHG